MGPVPAQHNMVRFRLRLFLTGRLRRTGNLFGFPSPLSNNDVIHSSGRRLQVRRGVRLPLYMFYSHGTFGCICGAVEWNPARPDGVQDDAVFFKFFEKSFNVFGGGGVDHFY